MSSLCIFVDSDLDHINFVLVNFSCNWKNTCVCFECVCFFPHNERFKFFEWCDNTSGTNSMVGGKENCGSNSSFPDLPCPCGAGSCLILTAKTGKNIGQQFYRCPANQVIHNTYWSFDKCEVVIKSCCLFFFFFLIIMLSFVFRFVRISLLLFSSGLSHHLS